MKSSTPLALRNFYFSTGGWFITRVKELNQDRAIHKYISYLFDNPEEIRIGGGNGYLSDWDGVKKTISYRYPYSLGYKYTDIFIYNYNPLNDYVRDLIEE